MDLTPPVDKERLSVLKQKPNFPTISQEWFTTVFGMGNPIKDVGETGQVFQASASRARSGIMSRVTRVMGLVRGVLGQAGALRCVPAAVSQVAWTPVTAIDGEDVEEFSFDAEAKEEPRDLGGSASRSAAMGSGGNSSAMSSGGNLPGSSSA